MRLIDADVLKVDFIYPSTTAGTPCYRYISKEQIDDAPTVESGSIRRGRWEFIGGYGYQYRCSKCFTCVGYTTNYCPHCGAKMDEVNE